MIPSSSAISIIGGESGLCYAVESEAYVETCIKEHVQAGQYTRFTAARLIYGISSLDDVKRSVCKHIIRSLGSRQNIQNSKLPIYKSRPKVMYFFTLRELWLYVMGLKGSDL